MTQSPISVARAVRFDSVGIALITCAQGALEGEQLGVKLGSAPGAEQLRLVLVRSGELRVVGGSSPEPMRAGCAVVTFSREADLQVVEAGEFFVIDAPLELIASAFGSRLPLEPFAISRESLLLRPTISFAAQLLNDRDGEFSGLGKYYVEKLLQEMLLGLLVDAKRIAKAPVASDPYLVAQAVIQVRLADPSLNTDEIAQEVRLSRRQLERLFSRNGHTVAGHIRRVRVEAAAEMLQDRAYAGLGVDQVARYVGFGSGSSLARAMSAEGFVSPSELRKQAA